MDGWMFAAVTGRLKYVPVDKPYQLVQSVRKFYLCEIHSLIKIKNTTEQTKTPEDLNLHQCDMISLKGKKNY